MIKAVNEIVNRYWRADHSRENENDNPLLIEHLARYHFASYYVYGKVLNFACGTGFGSHIIVKNCKEKVVEVVGLDDDEHVINYAKSTYYQPKTKFLVGDVTDPSLPGR